MSAEPPSPPRVRTFVALDLPAPVREAIEAWGARELADPALRPTPADKLHLTLAFLGHIPESDVERAAAIVTAARPRPVPMALAPGPAAKPPGRPRLFAIDVESPAAVELQAEVARGLIAAGLYEPETRPFWPHLTVARVRNERGRRRPRRVGTRPGELPQALVHTFDSVRIALYRSNLRPEGAQYVPLANLDLPPAG